jgi:hypothetical protein
MKTAQTLIALSRPYLYVGLNPLPHTQHNEGFGSFNEGNPNTALRGQEQTSIKAEFSIQPSWLGPIKAWTARKSKKWIYNRL